jgi:hypothetical protein
MILDANASVTSVGREPAGPTQHNSLVPGLPQYGVLVAPATTFNVRPESPARAPEERAGFTLGAWLRFGARVSLPSSPVP